MTDKAYIVANEQQEHEVLDKLEHGGFTWWGGDNLTENMPSKLWNTKFPYTIFVGKNTVTFNRLSKLEDEEIIFDGRKESQMITGYKDIKTNGNQGYLTDYKTSNDGRKEEHMSEKYVVSQEFMNKLNDWKNNLVKYNEPGGFIDIDDLEGLPVVVNAWWGDEVPDEENNNRLIAIIRWVNGEDVFEVEKPKKWIVRSKEHDGRYSYGRLLLANNNTVFMGYSFENATRFDTKEEAESWANSHQEVIEVEE